MKILRYLGLTVLVLVLVLVAWLFLPGLWNRWITYPDFQAEVEAFQQLRKEPSNMTALNTYRGLLHAHSYWSHDSEGTLARIIPAAKSVDIDFIFLTDHPHGDTDTFPRGYHGNYEGILIQSGSEKKGLCVWPMRSGTVDWSEDADSVVRRITSDGGLVFYAHSEEDHNWANPWFQGMEIYNIHTDSKDESLLPLVVNVLVNGGDYRHWALRELFDEQRSILSLWDSLNTHRKIVGFSAVDAHENQNLRARYLEDGRVEWVGPNADPVDTVQVSFWNRWLFDDPDEEGWIFKLMVDTYASSFNYVTNYVVSDSLSPTSLARHVKKGNLFFAFKSLGDAKGFMFSSQNDEGNVSAIVGDSISTIQAKSLVATSPLPGRFKLLRDGKTIDISAADIYDYKWNGPISKGVYRVEIHVTLGGQEIPWLYCNPIYVY